MKTHARFALSMTVVAALSMSACGNKASTSSSASPKSSSKPADSAAPTGKATLKQPKDPVEAGKPFTVEWTGPNGPDDYIDLVDTGRAQQVGDERSVAYVKNGNPAKLTAPEAAGRYDVRYVQDVGDRIVIAFITITVK